MEVSLKTVTPCKEAPFQRALQQYLQGLDDKSMAKDFFVNCYNQIRDNPEGVDPDNADQINSILQGRIDDLKKPSMTGKVMQTLAGLQQNYDSVVNSLITFDPTPISGAVWACVGVLAKAVDSYFKVPEKIADALIALGDDLKSIETYSRIFRSTSILEDVFVESYLDIFRFWNRVFQELMRKKPMRLLASLAGADKFDSNIADMRRNAERVKAKVKLAQKARAFEEKQEEKVRVFLGRAIQTAPASAYDSRISTSQQAMLEKQCCEWIFEHETYQSWLKGEMTPRALWVHGPPGSGKSTLCRKVAESVEEDEPSAVIASHYFRFDQNHTTYDVLKSLAVQLWDQWILRHSTPALLDTLAKYADLALSGHEPVKHLVMILHTLAYSLPSAYFFIDGVDEEVAKGAEGQGVRDSVKNALEVLDQMDKLIKPQEGCPATVRLWISSQDVPYAQKKFQAYVPFNIKETVKAGIHHYLSETIGRLTVIPQERRESIVKELVTRAESNFLWAHLMVVEMRKARTEADMDESLEDGRAEDLDDYYGRFFSKRLRDKKDMLLSRDVFSLVTFARYPLKVGEVREAVAVLRSGGGRLKATEKQTVFVESLLELFSPLIEVQHDGNTSEGRAELLTAEALTEDDPVMDTVEESPIAVDSTDDAFHLEKTCRLFHSTLFDFLQRNADMFYADDEKSVQNASDRSTVDFRISQLRIAESCLLYMSQARYASPLRQEHDVWVDMNGQPVSEHRFLVYSAKNWDKHLDLVAPDGSDYPSSQSVEESFPKVAAVFQARLEEFVASPNFQTCLQVLSIWVPATFCPFFVGDSKVVHVRRSLPRWCTHHMDYYRFWWDWGHFLGYSNWMDTRDIFKPFTGDVKRCWWGSLGSNNFLSKLPSHYPTFRYWSDKPKEHVPSFDDLLMQAALATPQDVKILWRTSEAHGMLNFIFEVWRYGRDKLPFLKHSQILSISETACRASFFAAHPSRAEGERSYSISGEGGRAPLAAFSDSGQCLRIGTQVYIIDDAGECRVFPGMLARREDYIEEIAGNADVVVVTNRGSVPVMLDSQVPQQDDSKSEFDGRREFWDDSGKVTELLEDVEGSDPSEILDDGGYESWSECSSVLYDLGRKAKSESDDISSTSESEFEENEDEDEDSDSDGDSGQEAPATDCLPIIEKPKTELTEGKGGGSEPASDSDPNDDDQGSPLLAFREIHGESEMYTSFGNVVVEDVGSSTDDEEQEDGYPASTEKYADGEDNDKDGEKEDKAKMWVVRRQQVSMRIFSQTGRTFSFLAVQSTPLSNSPPVLHPNQPLVVWPLDEWSILFVDYEDNTYFTHELGSQEERTSRRPNDTNFLMKCRFTSDGKYLHVASFQGRTIDSPFFACGPNPTFVSLIIYTYKLCANKPTRTPPALIHVKDTHFDLLDRARLYPKFPCTLTWTDSHVYIVRSCPALHIHKIPLFREQLGDVQVASQDGDTYYEFTKTTIPIPSSASEREVFFFPTADESFARLIVGAPIITQAGYVLPADVPTPIGCNLDFMKEIGGPWVSRNDPNRGKRYSEGSRNALDASQRGSDPGVSCVIEPLKLHQRAGD